MQPRKSQLRPYLNATAPMTGDAPSTAEWDPIRPNSMYRRVKQLDRVAQSTGLIQLTCAENQATSKALNLVIMAFAAQWSQGRRRREKMSPTPLSTLDPAQSEDMADEFEDEFEQNFQHSLWEQAKKALQDVAGVESYRAVYAELVFGLIQRPWAINDYPRSSLPRLSEDNNNNIRDMKLRYPKSWKSYPKTVRHSIRREQGGKCKLSNSTSKQRRRGLSDQTVPFPHDSRKMLFQR